MKIKAAIILILLITIFALPASADNGPFRKLGRGLCNVVTCPLEIIKGVSDANVESGYFAAATWGLLEGSFKMIVRCVVGAYETVTFPFPLPPHYEPILTDPEFFGEEMAF